MSLTGMSNFLSHLPFCNFHYFLVLETATWDKPYPGSSCKSWSCESPKSSQPSITDPNCTQSKCSPAQRFIWSISLEMIGYDWHIIGTMCLHNCMCKMTRLQAIRHEGSRCRVSRWKAGTRPPSSALAGGSLHLTNAGTLRELECAVWCFGAKAAGWRTW